VPKAIVVAVVADALLLAFILLRRTYRKRYFDKRDACVFKWRQKWDDLLSARVPYSVWRARILRFLRFSGLLEKRIFEARHFTSWRRIRALVRAECHRSTARSVGPRAGGSGHSIAGLELLQFVGDDLDELRAAAARALGRSPIGPGV